MRSACPKSETVSAGGYRRAGSERATGRQHRSAWRGTHLRQPSPRRRAYRLQRGDQTIGWLKFPPGRRSLALAEDEGTGSLVLTASAGRVEVRGGPDAAATIATVEHALAGVAVIRTVQGPMLRGVGSADGAVLLCLIGGFLALRALQTEIDGGTAVGGIVAAGVG